MGSNHIAVLMTCFNRKQKTLASLNALFNQTLPSDITLEVYLVDDASTDGTAEAIHQTYPQVKVLQGSGNLFWNGGMREAFAEAMKANPDFYLWLNDDTLLYPDAVEKLLNTFQTLTKTGDTRCVLIGATCDPQTGTLTYGGQRRSSRWHPLKFQLIEQPTDVAQPCETLNGNCVLIPRSVAQVVGNLDPAFVHSSGDFDYGLRVRKQGGSVWIAPGFVGTCERNPVQGTWEDPNLTIPQRWKKVIQAKGLPIQEWKVFAQRHAGALWPFYWGLPYIRLILISVFPKLGKKEI